MDKKIIFSYIKDISLRLQEPRKYGGVSLMIGAGFSKNAYSKGVTDIQPPNWTELAEKMYDELYPFSEEWSVEKKQNWNNQRMIKTSGKNVTKLAEEYIANFDRNQINNLIEQTIANDMFVPGELHKQLLKFQWADIFTTNYDTLLEETVDLVYRENNYKIVYSQSDLPGSSRPRIIKLHGSIPQIKPYIISDEDYRTYPERYPALVNTVQQAMLETRLCLIGFSGDDPNFQSWLGWIRDNMGEECPKIYLIGVYDTLNSPEIKLLENKGITVVDLSALVSEKGKNKHYVAFSEFFKILKEYQSKENKDIYLDRPYPEVNVLWKPKDEKKYLAEIQAYAQKVELHISPYILLPEKQREKFANYFGEHFHYILKNSQDIWSDKFAELLKNIIRILRKCLIVLDDNSASRLDEIFNAYNEKDKYTSLCCEISLYLLEMYRIDGKKDEYNLYNARFRKLIEKDVSYNNDYLVENIKNSISKFDYVKAAELVERIETTTFEYKVKKAGFYKQLSQAKTANNILNEVSAELAQMRLPDDIYASYLGYLNLCYRVDHWKIDTAYSDMNYYGNPFNVRKIIVEQMEKLKQNLFEKERKKEESQLPFNLNSNRATVRYYNTDNLLYSESFIFIISIDRLCLPLFSDQKKLLPRVIDEIIGTSKNTYWKMSLAIRSDNEKVINQIFTRKAISKMNDGDKKELVDTLFNLLKFYKKETGRKKYFADVYNILSVLSYLVVFLEDLYVVKFLDILCGFADKTDSIIISKVNKIIQTISTRFNSNIAKQCYQIIFFDFPGVYMLAKYFTGITLCIDEEFVDKYYQHSIDLLKSDDNVEKDNGVAQLLLLWKNHKKEKYRDLICENLWKEKRQKFPDSETYYPFIWEELPYPEQIDFSKLYYNYLLELRFIESVTTTGYVGNNSAGSVFNYLHLFYMFSDVSPKDCKKIQVDAKLAKEILNHSYKFLIHERELLTLDFDLMGEKEECERKFSLICELVAFVYIQAIIHDFGTSILGLVIKIKEILNQCNICVKSIEMVDLVTTGDYDSIWNCFDNIILSKNKDNYSQAFTGLQCMLYYIANKGKSMEKVDSLFEGFFNAIKYMDIEYAKTLWIHIGPLLKNHFFVRNNAQKYVAVSIKACIEMYRVLADEGERFYLDGLYNCVTALNKYCQTICADKTEMILELKECLNIAKSIDNYEIGNILN